MPSIPASAIVQVVPGVVSAGGSALALNGLLLTNSTRSPIGTVQSYGSAAAVAAAFGGSSAEATAAGIYFNGFLNSTVKPGALLIAQYPQVAVPAYLRGGSVAALTLAQLQALSGTLSVTVEGVLKTSGTINFSSASSFSNAATLITTGFAAYDAVTGAGSTIAAGTATNSTAASITGNVMTVGATVTGAFVVGGVLSGTGVTAGTTILAQLTGTAGGVGTYLVSAIQNVASTTISQTYGLLTVATMVSGALAVGQVISGGTTAVGTTITALGSGTGQAGTYVVSGGAQTVTATTISAGPLVCTFDSVSSAFVLTGGTPGAAGTIGYATGSLSASLNLTAVTGATLSQGSAPGVPATFMSGVIAQTDNWATFMTLFDPDNGYGNSAKQAFAAWNNSFGNNNYAYIAWDTDLTPTLSTSAPSSLGAILKAAGTSGTFPIFSVDYTLAAFAMGAIASINFAQPNGRVTLAFKQQAGLVPSVTSQTVGSNLIANGYNFYGSYATANQGFTFLYPGLISGQFLWGDAYVDQIWLNNGLQLALMSLLTQINAVPYDAAGYALLRAACMGQINAGLLFGAFAGGVNLSPAQIAEVNAAAGTQIDQVLSSQGWYLQILPASAQVRAARGTPPMTLWYVDAGAVQSISLASISVQ